MWVYLILLNLIEEQSVSYLRHPYRHVLKRKQPLICSIPFKKWRSFSARYAFRYFSTWFILWCLCLRLQRWTCVLIKSIILSMFFEDILSVKFTLQIINRTFYVIRLIFFYGECMVQLTLSSKDTFTCLLWKKRISRWFCIDFLGLRWRLRLRILLLFRTSFLAILWFIWIVKEHFPSFLSSLRHDILNIMQHLLFLSI